MKLAEEQQEGGTCNKMLLIVTDPTMSKAQGCGNRMTRPVEQTLGGLPFPREGFQQHSQVVFIFISGLPQDVVHYSSKPATLMLYYISFKVGQLSHFGQIELVVARL